MKTTLILALALFALKANAYTSAPSGDPNLGFRDVEYMTVEKVDSVTGYDDAITKGQGVFFEDGAGSPADQYHVSRIYSGTYNTAAAVKVTACIAARNVATGDTGGFPCVVKGYVDFAKYIQGHGAAIAIGTYLCVDDLTTAPPGTLVGCASGVSSQFIALEAKSEDTSGTIKVRVVSP
jgi:hypothetical protein